MCYGEQTMYIFFYFQATIHVHAVDGPLHFHAIFYFQALTFIQASNPLSNDPFVQSKAKQSKGNA